jgi:hypothetical protein
MTSAPSAGTSVTARRVGRSAPALAGAGAVVATTARSTVVILKSARRQREPLRARPRGDLALGDLAHQLPVALHALAVERRQQQLALRQMRVLVEDEHRAAAEHGPQDRVGLARAQHARVAGEDLLDRVRVREEDPRSLVDDPDREDVAVARAAALHERHRPRDPAEGAERRRVRRRARQRGVARDQHGARTVLPASRR